jgi:hypothetical protein
MLSDALHARASLELGIHSVPTTCTTGALQRVLHCHPYAAMFQPDISICRVFGAVAYALIPPKLQIGKLKDRAVVAGLWVTSRPWVTPSVPRPAGLRCHRGDLRRDLRRGPVH